MYKVFNTRAKVLLCFFCSWNLLFVAFFTLLSLKQKHKQLVVGFPVLRPRRFGRLCTLIFCRGRWDVQIVKLTCRAFSLYCELNCAIGMRHSSNFRVCILSSSDQTLIFFPTRNWTNVKSFKLETEFQQVRKSDENNKLTVLSTVPSWLNNQHLES